MKNFSKKKFTGKNNKDYKKNSDIGYHKKNTNRLEKKEQFSSNYSKNKNVENLNKKDKNNTFSSLKERQKFKSNREFSNKNLDKHQDFTTKRNFDDWIWGKHSVYEALSSDRAIIGFGVLRRFFLQINSIFCLRTLKPKES